MFERILKLLYCRENFTCASPIKTQYYFSKIFQKCAATVEGVNSSAIKRYIPSKM